MTLKRRTRRLTTRSRGSKRAMRRISTGGRMPERRRTIWQRLVARGFESRTRHTLRPDVPSVEQVRREVADMRRFDLSLRRMPSVFASRPRD